MKAGGQRHALAALLAGKRPVTLWRGGWIGPRASLDGFRKTRPHRDSIPDRPARRESLRRLSYTGPLSRRYNWYNECAVLCCALWHTIADYTAWNCTTTDEWRRENNLERGCQGARETKKNNSQPPGFETEAPWTQVYIVTATSTSSVNVGKNVAN